MNEPEPSQKEFGQRYKGNLRYFKFQSFPQRMRFYLCVLAVLLAVAAVMWSERPGHEKIYNPAPLPISHVFLEGDCQACHGAKMPDRDAIHQWNLHPASYSEAANTINVSCQKCHADKDLHQPAPQTLALAQFRSEMRIVGSTGCFGCHQEHLGRISMRLPGDAACAGCHNDATAMASNALILALSASAPSLAAIHGITPDGLIHFIAPRTSVPLFGSFASGHPPFDYERPGLRDPDVLQFDHQLHLTDKTVIIKGQKLDCAYCHKLDADGVYYRRVTYETGCQECHSLKFDPRNPELMIPHGNVERVRLFLHSLPFQYQQIAERKFKSPMDQRYYVLNQMLALKQEALKGVDFEQQIFFAKNPYKDSGPGIFPGCAYCHEVRHSGAGRPDDAPMVTEPSMADRWLSHGRFTHAMHVSVSCTSCHDANHSRLTADIIMPSKESCVTCHSPAGKAPGDCLACHTFHAPVETAQVLKGERAFPPSVDPKEATYLKQLLSHAGPLP